MAITISSEAINQAIEKINVMDNESLHKLSEAHTLAQPTLISYILSSSIEFNNEDLAEYAILYFNYLMEAVALQGINVNAIGDDIIDGFQDEYVATLNEFMETEDIALLETMCNQPNMLAFFLEDINAEDENGEVLEEEMASMVFIVGIALIALLNRGINGVPLKVI